MSPFPSILISTSACVVDTSGFWGRLIPLLLNSFPDDRQMKQDLWCSGFKRNVAPWYGPLIISMNSCVGMFLDDETESVEQIAVSGTALTSMKTFSWLEEHEWLLISFKEQVFSFMGIPTASDWRSQTCFVISSNYCESPFINSRALIVLFWRAWT